MLNILEASVIMLIRLIQISKLLLIVLGIMLLIQLITYQLSNKKINLYKKFNKLMNKIINANI